ncbi:serine hydrolase domain-containing protein [Reinekea sp.]|jgi:CubicO group peptidase (beta-lactamase class C family)|uniref:serine hydrolase domain-containing protein n=1 Tax=Reinekea sp. TaxID=1970455 RepID=UPI003989907C
MKKWLIRVLSASAAVIALLLAVAYWGLGYSPKYLANAPSVATGIGAKLACSAKYVSGFNENKIAADIKVYSSILALLNYQYNDDRKTVVAALGPFARSASFQQGVGCYLDYKQSDPRKSIAIAPVVAPLAAWPKGDVVFTIDNDIQTNLDQMLKSDNQQGHDTRALLVVKNGKIVAESYAKGIDSSTPLLGWSMTKSVNSLLIGQLEMEALVDVDDTNLFKQWKDERKAIRLEDLLTMTDGLAYEEEYDPGQIATKMLFQSEDTAKFMKKVKLRHTPGEYFEYSSGTANLLSDIIHQRLEGSNQQDIVEIYDRFFRPLAMSSVVLETDAQGLLMGSSYMFASARDWAKIGQLMLNKGELNGHRFVTQSWVERSITPNSSENKGSYGYQWWLNKGSETMRWPSLPKNSYAALGNREQRVLVVPDEQLVVVRLGWSKGDYIGDENFSTIVDWFK